MLETELKKMDIFGGNQSDGCIRVLASAPKEVRLGTLIDRDKHKLIHTETNTHAHSLTHMHRNTDIQRGIEDAHAATR